MSANQETARPRAAVVWSLALGSLSLMTAAGVVGAPALLKAQDAAAQAAARELQPADSGLPVKGSKPPEAFGFPAYPGSFGFYSLERGAGSGTSAFSVKKGTAVEVVRYYRKSLEPRGWTFTGEGSVTQPLGEGPDVPPPARGLFARWEQSAEGRRFELKAFDLKQKDSTAQVLLGWAPL